MPTVVTWLEPNRRPARSGGRFFVQVVGVPRDVVPWASLRDDKGGERMEPVVVGADATGKYLTVLSFPAELQHGDKVFATVELRAGDAVRETVSAREPFVIEAVPRAEIESAHGDTGRGAGKDDPKSGSAVKAVREYPVDVVVDAPPWGEIDAYWLLWRGTDELREPHSLPPPADDGVRRERVRVPARRSAGPRRSS